MFRYVALSLVMTAVACGGIEQDTETLAAGKGDDFWGQSSEGDACKHQWSCESSRGLRCRPRVGGETVTNPCKLAVLCNPAMFPMINNVCLPPGQPGEGCWSAADCVSNSCRDPGGTQGVSAGVVGMVSEYGTTGTCQ